MSRNLCNDINETMEEAYHVSQVVAGVRSFTLRDMVRNATRTDKFWRWIDKKYKSKEAITEAEVSKMADKVYGVNTETEKFKMILKIESALERRPDIIQMFYRDAYDYVRDNGKNLMLDTTVFKNEYLDDGKTLVVDLQKLPYGSIKSLFLKLAEDYFPLPPDGDLDTPKNSFLNGTLFEFMLPRNIAKRTTNVSLRDFIKSLTHTGHRRESMERKFTTRNPKANLARWEYELKMDKQGRPVIKDNKPVFTKTPIRYNRRVWGITQMYDEISILYADFGNKYFAEERQFMEFMHMYMQDRIKIDGNGDMILKRKWRKAYKGGEPIVREDGSFVYRFSDEEPIIMKNGRMVNYDSMHRDMDWDKQKKIKIPGKTTEYLNISDAKPKVGRSDWHQMIDWMSGIQSHLRHFGNNIKIISDKNNRRFERLTARAKSELTQDELAVFRDMALEIGEVDPFEIHGLNKIELVDFSRMYFPRKLTAGNRIRVLGAAREEIESKLENTRQLLKDETLKQSTVRRIKAERRELLFDLKTIEDKMSILDSVDTQFDESNSMNPIFLQNYINNFRSVTNMVPHQFYRLDDLVVKDYISETSRQIERRRVSMDLLELYINSKGKPKIREFAMNMFKRAFQYPDAKGRIMGMTVTDDDLNRLMKSIGFNTDKHNLNRYLKDMSGIYTGNLLSGITDGYVNYFSVLQDIITSGTDAWVNAKSQFIANREYWVEKAEKAGLNTFSKYLEGYVDNVLRTEDQEQIRMYRDIINEMIQTIDGKDYKNSYKDKKELKRRYLKELALMEKALPSRFSGFASGLAKLAVTHKIEVETYSKNTFGKKAKKFISGVASIPKSIQETEVELRTIAYIIGYQNAQKLMRNHPKINEESLDQMAREYVYHTQFGLESYLVGEALGSTFTKFLNGITTFRKQKTAWDVEKNRDWLRAYWNPNKILDDAKFRTKKRPMRQLANGANAGASMLFRLIGDVFTFNPAKAMRRREILRKAAPEIAKGEQFFLIYGLTTAFMNFYVFANPTLGAVTGAVRRFVFDRELTKVGTGFISPLYLGILATGSLGYGIGKSILTEEEELEFYDFYKWFRSLYGTAWMDMFVLAYKAGQKLTDHVQGDTNAYPSSSTYYNDPSRHGTWNTGPVSVVKKIADKAVSIPKYVHDEWFEDRDFGHY